MFDMVVVLTPEGKPFKIFLREKIFDYYREILNTSILVSFKHLRVVTECHELLGKLVSASNTVTGFAILKEIQEKIKSDADLAKSSAFFLDNRIQKRETNVLVGVSGHEYAPYDAHRLSLDALIQFIETHYFSIYSENAKSGVYVLLSEKGNSVRLFLDNEATKEYMVSSSPKEVSCGSELDDFSDLWVVKEHRSLLKQLMGSSDPATIVEAFKSIQAAIAADHLSTSERLKKTCEGSDLDLSFLDKNNRLRTSMAFVHQCTTSHPDHDKQENFMFRNTAGHLTHVVAHRETLENAIKFIEEYCFSHYEDEKRKQFVKGFQYQNSSWSAPSTWVGDWLQRTNEDYENGRKVAIAQRKK